MGCCDQASGWVIWTGKTISSLTGSISQEVVSWRASQGVRAQTFGLGFGIATQVVRPWNLKGIC